MYKIEELDVVQCNFYMESRDIAANSLEKNDLDREIDKLLKEAHDEDSTFNTNIINVEMLLNFTDYYKFQSRVLPIVFNILMLNKDCFIK